MGTINNTKLLNKNIISASTDKAYLIKIPKKQYFVWMSRRFINHYEYSVSIGIIEEWNYKLITNNGNLIMNVSGIDLLELFNGSKTIRNTQLVKLDLKEEELEN